MLEERQDAEEVMAQVEEKERIVVEYLEKAKALRERWETLRGDASREADRIRREAIRPRKINFVSPTDHQPLTTSKDNMKKAAKLLAKNDEEININHLRTLVASAMKQQSKADTSCRLESNPKLCVFTAQKDALGRERHDEESRTGSMERRRTREHPNPIPAPSKTPPADPNNGNDPMYTSRDKYRNSSPPPRNPHPPPPPRRPSPAGNTDPMGPVELTSATTWLLR
nr:actin cytoskeleton-regulatory complex protein PAN1-like [Lolium perenne]